MKIFNLALYYLLSRTGFKLADISYAMYYYVPYYNTHKNLEQMSMYRPDQCNSKLNMISKIIKKYFLN